MPEAGNNYADAQRSHSEAFLRYKLADPKRTDGVARAMADVDVDLVGARVDWEIALMMHQYILKGVPHARQSDA